MNEMNRRKFLETAATAAGAIAVGTALPAEVLQEGKTPTGKLTRKVQLGKTGVKPSLIGIGTGSVGWNHQSNQTKLGQAKFTALMMHAYESGITFFDVADQYGSMPYLKEFLTKVPREKIVIQTKSNSRDPEKMRADLDRFRKELGTDYVDTLLIHCVTEADWNVRYRGIMDVLEEAKQKKIVRAHGVSCHSFEALEAASKDPWVEVDLARYNPWGHHMDIKKGETKENALMHVGPVLKKMHKAGKGVIGMKVLAQADVMKGSDKLARARESLKFSGSAKFIDAMVIGFESPEQVTEVIKETQVAMLELGLQMA